MHWNINSFNRRQQELRQFLSQQQVDIVCLNEIRKAGDNVRITNYDVHYKNRADSNYGGVALLVHHRIKSAPITVETSIETIAVNIDNKLTITAAYCHPRTSLNTADIDRLMRLNDQVIIAGDLNAKHDNWNNTTPNSNGELLYNHSAEAAYSIEAPAEPTFPHSESTLDIVLVKNCAISSPRVVEEFESDHLPIMFDVLSTQVEIQTSLRLAYNKTDWHTYKKLINDRLNISQLRTTQDIDDEVHHLTTVIQEAMQDTTPVARRKPNELLHTAEIQNILAEKRRARRRYKRTRDIRDWEMVLRLAEDYRTKVTDASKSHYHERLLRARHQDGTIWPLVRNCRPRPAPANALIINGTKTSNKLEIGNHLAESFESAHELQPLTDPHLRRTIDKSYEFIRNVIEIQPNIMTTDIYETTRIIAKLKIRKAPGEDNVSNMQIKHLPKKGVAALTNIYNACFALQYFPKKWKHAIVVPLPKPGKPKNMLKSYRPISLLPTLSKVFEKIIGIRLDKHFKNENIAIAHSTTHQLYRLTDHIRHIYNIGKHTGLVCLDLQQAFDKVWHRGLVHKLKQTNLPLPMVRLLSAYLENRTFTVRLGHHLSDTKTAPAGVPQGSVLGPKLFILHINDLPHHPGTHVALFADDTALYAFSSNVNLLQRYLQEHLQSIEHYFQTWRLSLNAAKTQYCVFSKRLWKEPEQKLEVCQEIIQPAKQIEYLGVTLDSRLAFHQHVKKLRSKANQSIGYLYKLINKRSPLNISTKKLLYTNVVKPTMTYAAPIWSTASRTSFHQLELAQLRALKIIAGLPRSTSSELVRNKFQLPTMYKSVLGTG